MPNATSSPLSTLADRYTIERLLGQGGMPIVHLAEEPKHQRKVLMVDPLRGIPRFQALIRKMGLEDVHAPIPAE